MGDLSEGFSRSEFACKCGCGQDTIDAKLIQVLERLKITCKGAVVRITSGNRCVEYNKKIGGKVKSQHVLSRAADVVVTGYTSNQVFNILDGMHPSSLGLGLYVDKGFVHIDTRNGRARW